MTLKGYPMFTVGVNGGSNYYVSFNADVINVIGDEYTTVSLIKNIQDGSYAFAFMKNGKGELKMYSNNKSARTRRVACKSLTAKLQKIYHNTKFSAKLNRIETGTDDFVVYTLGDVFSSK